MTHIQIAEAILEDLHDRLRQMVLEVSPHDRLRQTVLEVSPHYRLRQTVLEVSPHYYEGRLVHLLVCGTDRKRRLQILVYDLGFIQVWPMFRGKPPAIVGLDRPDCYEALERVIREYLDA